MTAIVIYKFYLYLKKKKYLKYLHHDRKRTGLLTVAHWRVLACIVCEIKFAALQRRVRQMNGQHEYTRLFL